MGGGRGGKRENNLQATKYPKLYDKTGDAEEKLRPSELMERSMGQGPQLHAIRPTIIEVLNMADYTHSTHCDVDVDDPIFQPHPTAIHYERFEALEHYETVLCFRNNDTVARRMKILPVHVPFLTIKAVGMETGGMPQNKVAPGMEAKYVVHFSPEKKVDYAYDIIVATEREKFLVPFRASGARAVIDFPDKLTFEGAPVKCTSTKTILVRNVGEVASSFRLSTEEPFSVEPLAGFLSVGESMQLNVSFLPDMANPYKGEIVVKYDSGETVYIAIEGISEELNVRLDTDALICDPTYIHLSSRKTVSIINRSDFTVHFEWKAMQETIDEEEERQRLAAADIDADQSMALTSSVAKEVRFKQTNKLLFPFTDAAFRIEPMSGDVWPYDEQECTINFTPLAAIDYSATAFCDVSGREVRLPLHLKAEGAGPRLSLSFDVLDIGEVFINSVHKYEMEMENSGEIEAYFELIDERHGLGPRFEFSPQKGKMQVGAKIPITILFSSSALGEFSEQFNFELQGSPDPIPLVVRGSVIGPTFYFDKHNLQYGTISVGFLSTHYLTLFNTSQVPFKYVLRIPADGTFLQRQFDIIPATGVIMPAAKQRIQIDFVPARVDNYDVVLVMDIETVGENLIQVPINANCCVPRISLSTTLLDFEHCFLHHPYTLSLTLKNDQDLLAQYEVTPQDERSETVALFKVDHPRGVISSRSKAKINVTFTAQRLGNIQLPLWVKVLGSRDASLNVTMSCHCTGPRVLVDPPELKWMGVPVLESTSKTIELHNDSLIEADFKSLVIGKNSVFKVHTMKGVMAPGEKRTIEVACFLDEITPFQDELHVVVQYGDDITVPLRARGVGSTIHCESALTTVEMEHRYTNQVHTMEYVLTNKGRRPQALQWLNLTKIPPPDASAPPPTREEDSWKTAFVVQPDRMTLEPRTSALVKIKGYSRTAKQCTEKLVCRSTMGKATKVIYETEVSADFIDPLLQLPEKKIEFSFKFAKGEELAVQRKTFQLKNQSQLELQAYITPPAHFTVEPNQVLLQPGEVGDIEVRFHPALKIDKKSAKINSALTITYQDHPQKDYVQLLSTFQFPNVELQTKRVNFGTILNHTSKRVVVLVTNTSEVDTHYCWSFLDDEDEDEFDLEKRSQPRIAGSGRTTPRTNKDAESRKAPSEAGPLSARSKKGGGAKSVKSSKKKPNVPINNVFDILPITSMLKPGESEQLEFIYYGHPNTRFEASAICEVHGGPEYEVRLNGAASMIEYQIDKYELDFGMQLYNSFSERQILIQNTGTVRFDFLVNTDEIKEPMEIQVLPVNGRIAAGDKLQIGVKMLAGTAERLTVKVNLYIAHFEPTPITLIVQGLVPQPLLTLPRLRPAEFDALVKQAEINLAPLIDEIMEKYDRDVANLKGREPKGLMVRSEITRKLHEAEADRLMLRKRILDKLNKEKRAAERREARRQARLARGLVASADEDEIDDDGVPAEIDGVPREVIEAALATQGARAVPPVPLDQIGDAEAPELDTQKTDDLGEEEAEAADKELDEAAAEAAAPSEADALEELDAIAAALPPETSDEVKVEEVKTEEKRPDSSWDRPPKFANGSMLLADYLCDFGNVVKGHQCKRKFRLTNIGNTMLNLDFSKALLSHLAKFGITLDPVRVGKLPGYPEWESFELQITLTTSGPEVALGQTHALLPILMRNAPAIGIVIRAFVTLPELELNTENLDFGTLQVGMMRMLPVQMTNHKVVPVEYSFRPAASKEGICRDIECIPFTGVLQPGEQRNVKILLSPTSERLLTAQLPLRLKDNPKETRIKVKAVAKDIRIKFDPPVLALPPLTPFSAPTEMRVRMKNDSDFPAEVIALDVDEWIIEEYNIVSHLPFDASDVMHMPVRLPGRPFDENLAEQGRAAIESERLAAEKAAEAEASNEKADATETPGEVGELEPAAPMVRDQPDVDKPVEPKFEPNLVNILLHGPTGQKVDEEGKVIAEPRKELAIQLAERYSVKCITIDELIEDCANAPTELGRKVRVALGLPEELPQPAPVSTDNVDSKVEDAAAELTETAEPAATEQDTQPIDDVSARLRPDQCIPLEPELLGEVLSKRLSRNEYRFGVVINGLETRYMPPDGLMETAKAVEEAMRGRHLHFMHIELKEPEPEEEIDPKAKKPPPKAAPAKGKGGAPAAAGPMSDEDFGNALTEFLHDEEKNGEIIAFFTPPEPPAPEEVADGTEGQASGGQPSEEEPADGDEEAVKEEPPELTEEEKIEAAAKEFENLSEGFRLFDLERPPDATKSAQHVVKEVDEHAQALFTKVLEEAGSKLPAPFPKDQKRQLPLPDIITRHVLHKPQVPFRPAGLRHFILLTPRKDVDEEGNPTEVVDMPEGWATVVSADGDAAAAPDKAKAAPAKGKKGEAVEEEKPPEKPKTRWVLLAQQDVELVVRFRAEKVGKYEQKLRFGVMGSTNEFTLPCRSICAYPQISTDYRNVFYRKKKTRAEDEFVNRQYVVSRGAFEFGPLLVGKDREGYDEGKCNDSSGRFRITNNGLFPLNIDFTFRNDFENKCFMLEPPSMALDIDETADLTVWSFPPEEGLFEDELICCIKENPSCPTFKIAANGSRPKIEFDTLEVAFERLLPGRAERQRVELKNVSMLQAKWNLDGLEDLEEEISVFPTSGTLAPKQTVSVVIDFKTFEGREPKMFDKTLTFVVQDVQALLEPTQTETLKITAESFNINTSVMLGAPDPKAAPDIEGAKNLDFGVIRVSGSAQKTLTLINNGKYDVNFKWSQKSKRAQFFKIEPKQGLLEGQVNADPKTGSKPVPVTITFDTDREVSISNLEDVKCHFYETETGEFTHSVIPTISARSVFSKYRVTPSSGINFGAMMYGSKKQRSFTINNLGEFDFVYTIADWSEVVTRPPTSEGEPDDKKAPPAPKAAPAKGAGDALQFGPFKISKGTDTIPPGGEKVLEVEYCAEDSTTESKEVLSVQISDRDESAEKHGVRFVLNGDSCVPGINCKDMDTVFEEHVVVKKFDPLGANERTYSLDQRAFSFGAVFVNEQIEAKIRISNPFKIPCNVDFLVKKRATSKDEGEIPFDVQPTKVSIPMHEHRYVSLYFTPPALSTFSAVFEATVENGTDKKTNFLTFDIKGDGTLPRVSIIGDEYALNDDGKRVVSFGRVMTGKHKVLPLLLRNDGAIAATVQFEAEVHAEFNFSGRGQECVIEPKGSKAFEFKYLPAKAQPSEPLEVKLKVNQNPFEETTMMLTGEGFHQELSMDGLADDSQEVLSFGDVPVGVEKQIEWTVVNNTNEPIRFEFEQHETLTFSPVVGHVMPHSTKPIAATFRSAEPVNLEAAELSMRTQKIKIDSETVDWDDRMTSVRWVSAAEMELAEALKELDEELSTLEKGWASEEKEIEQEFQAAAAAKKKPDPKAEEAHAEQRAEREKERDVKREEFAARKKEKVQSAGSTKGPKNRKLVEPVTEPPYTPVEEAEPQTVTFQVNAVSDHIQYEIADGLSEIVFKPTMMYQARAYSFDIINTGNVRFNSNWHISNAKDIRESASRSGKRPSIDLSSLFSITPTQLSLLPQERKSLTVRFAPLEVAELRSELRGTIPSLTQQPQPIIALRGKSMRPMCHFELADSDYLTSGRRAMIGSGPGMLTVPIDQDTRVIEFESLGVKVRNTKRFYILNPTNIAYEFTWTCLDADKGRGGAFTCTTKKGVVLPGKKFEVVFEYTPEADQMQESLWKFEIAEQNIVMSFLLVGHVVEPKVALDRSMINFRELLIGGKATQTVTIANSEYIPFAFSFESLGDDAQVLRVSPSSGTIGPQGSMTIEVTFMPVHERSYNFNLICNVKKKATHLMLNVKGEGYAIQCHVTLENSAGSNPIELHTGITNHVDLGQIQVNETRTQLMSIHNSGHFGLQYTFDWRAHRHLQVTPLSGAVGKSEKSEVELRFLSLHDSILDHYPATLQIVNGPKYVLAISATCRRPRLQFSFMRHDFGPCLLHQHGRTPSSAVLNITNEDAQDISFDTNFNNTPFFECDAAATVLAPRESKQIKFTFMPKELKIYEEQVEFEVNQHDRQTVSLKGEGAELGIELSDPRQFNITFGAIRVDNSAEKSIKVSNRGKVGTSFSITEETLAALEENQIDLQPQTTVFLKPRESMHFALRFRPTSRVSSFKQEIVFVAEGIRRTLAVVSGAGHGIECKLESESLYFGIVAQNSRTMRKLVIENLGDIGTKFRWDTSAIKNDFTIVPSEGSLVPHGFATLEVFMHPTRVAEDIRYDRVRCQIDGSSPLLLSLSGACTAQQPEGTPLSFTAEVRKTDVKSVPIKNSSNSPWTIRPTITDSTWTGLDSFDIPPNGTANYELTYRPLHMTGGDTGKDPHAGSVFFPLPDGTGLLYDLTGEAKPPSSSGTITKEVPAKASHIEVLTVKNWLPQLQKFKVQIERPEDASVLVRGSDSIDVPPNAERDYKVNFYAFKESVTKAKVTFINENTKEYQFYELEIKAVQPGVLATLDIQTAVRQSVARKVSVSNPLGMAVQLQCSCTSNAVTVAPTATVEPGTEVPIEFLFRPLLCKEEQAKLTVTSTELGNYVWDLNLSATEAPADASLQFKASLGTLSTQTFRFQSYTKDKCDYKCSVDSAEFAVEPATVSANPAAGPEGSEVTCEVRYEPSGLGQGSGKLTVQSEVGGTYICNLQGQCLAPKPQGPIEVKPGGSATVTIKNPKAEALTFTYAVDNPAFKLSAATGQCGPKATTTVNVSYQQSAPGVTTSAKLTVNAPDLPPWIYYLKGWDNPNAGGAGGGKKK